MPKVGTHLPRCYQGPLNGVYTQHPSPLQRSDGKLSDVPLCSSPGAGGGGGPRGVSTTLSPTTHSDKRSPQADGTSSPHGAAAAATTAAAAVSGSAGISAASHHHHHHQHHHQHQQHHPRLFPPIQRPQKGGASAQCDSIGRRVPPRPQPAKKLRNLVNQFALRTLLSAKESTLATSSVIGPASEAETAAAFSGLRTQAETLTLIRKRTAADKSSLDLRNASLGDEDMFLLASLVKTHPSLTSIDLSGNHITEASAHLLLETVAANRGVSAVRLDDAAFAPASLKAVDLLCGDNAARRRARDERRRRRRERREVARRRRREEAAREAVRAAEREGRAAVRAAARGAAAEARGGFDRTLAALLRREVRARARAARARERGGVEAAEGVRRAAWAEAEAGTRALLLTPAEAAVRAVVVAEQGCARAMLKKAENSGWVVQKRAEKARLKQEAGERRALELAEAEGRQAVFAAQRAAAHAAAQAGQESKVRCEGLLQARLDDEAAAAWKKKQEEMRIEAERQWKEDRETQARQRREVELQRERDKEARVEHLKRLRFEKEEDRNFGIITEVCVVAHQVAVDHERWTQAEQERVRLYAATPAVSLDLDVEQNKLHYLGVMDFSALVVDAAVSLSLPCSEAKWRDAEKAVVSAKQSYTNSVLSAAQLLRTRSVDFAPVLLPHLSHPPPPQGTKGPASPSSGTSGRGPPPGDGEAGAEYLAEVESAYANKEAVVRFDASVLQFGKRMGFDEARDVKTAPLCGSFSVDMSQDEGFENCDVFLTHSEHRSTQSFRMELGENPVVAEVGRSIKNVLYRCSVVGEKYASRVARFTLRLELRTLPRNFATLGALDASSFTEVAHVEAEAEVQLLMAPALLSAPPEALAVTYTEGTPFDKCALLSEVTLSRLPQVLPPLIMPSQDTTYQGGKLGVTFKENYTEEDEFLLRKHYEDDINIVDGKMMYGDKGEGPVVGTVTEGTLLTHRDRDERGVGASCPHVELSFTSPLCTVAFVHKLLKRLRFANASLNPSELPRLVEVTLTPPDFGPCSLTVKIDVVSEDDPTTLELKYQKLYYRPQGPSSVPEQLREHLKPAEIPLFQKCKVIDPDTTHFHCGSIDVTCVSGAAKGDTVCVRESGGMAVAGRLVTYYGVHMADLVEGPSANSVSVALLRRGEASIEFVQSFLRNIVYRNTLYTPPEGWRTYELRMMLGPSTDKPGEMPEATSETELLELTGKVELRTATDLFDIGSHWGMDYKEGSGAVRLAPFEVMSDQAAFVETYQDGHILVEIVEGATPDDILNLRPATSAKDGDISYKVRPSAALELEERLLLGLPLSPGDDEASQGAASEAGSAPSSASTPRERTLSPHSAHSSQLNLKDRMRMKIQASLVEKRERQDGLVDKMREGMRDIRSGVDEKAGRGDLTVTDIFMAQRRVAVLAITPSHLLIRFESKSKATRKDVLALLRLLTYANRSNDPDMLKKVLRIELKDGALAATQVLLQIDIQNVDDVTEIIMENSRVRYRPGMQTIHRLTCYAPAQMRRAVMVDPDTEFFDGGLLTVELSGGGVKGDTLGFMTVEQQRLAKAAADEYLQAMTEKRAKEEKAGEARKDDVEIWEHDLYEGELKLNGKQILDSSDRAMGTLELSRSTVAGANTLRIAVEKHHPPMITAQVMTYMLNCVTYTSTSEKLQPGQRIYLIKVKDGENPVCLLFSVPLFLCFCFYILYNTAGREAEVLY